MPRWGPSISYDVGETWQWKQDRSGSFFRIVMSPYFSPLLASDIKLFLGQFQLVLPIYIRKASHLFIFKYFSLLVDFSSGHTLATVFTHLPDDSVCYFDTATLMWRKVKESNQEINRKGRQATPRGSVRLIFVFFFISFFLCLPYLFQEKIRFYIPPARLIFNCSLCTTFYTPQPMNLQLGSNFFCSMPCFPVL